MARSYTGGGLRVGRITRQRYPPPNFPSFPRSRVGMQLSTLPRHPATQTVEIASRFSPYVRDHHSPPQNRYSPVTSTFLGSP
ncbi:hypothetical protein D9M70_134570 [compost metagenome]